MRVSGVAVFIFVCAVGGCSRSGPDHADEDNSIQLVRQAVFSEQGAGVPEVSTEDLEQILRDQSAVVLDTRPRAEWSLSHISGAVNVAPKPGVPLALYTSDVAEVGRLIEGDKSQPLVLYCNGPYCGKSKRVAEELVEADYTNVRRYQLGGRVHSCPNKCAGLPL